jgi:uncharacterized coiled-coil DUF342 family protein
MDTPAPTERISRDYERLKKAFREFKRDPNRKKSLIEQTEELQDQLKLDKETWWPEKRRSYTEADGKILDEEHKLSEQVEALQKEIFAMNVQMARLDEAIKKIKTSAPEWHATMRECIAEMKEHFPAIRD